MKTRTDALVQVALSVVLVAALAACGSVGGTVGISESEVTLAEGTQLKVRTTTTLSTKTHKVGDTFSASLEEPLVAEGKTVASKGASVTGKIVDADPGGRVKGRARITVRLIDLETDGGETIDVNTNTIARQAQSTKKEDATKIGIGSAVGAGIGAVAGGGKGAAVGAAAGAGAGTGAVLATRGDPAVIPAESVLTFQLKSPLSASVEE